MIIIGIDHGNSQVKTAHACFTSGITEHGTAKPPIQTDMICYAGNYYTISSKREPYKRDKTTDDKCFIMTLFAIAKELIATNVDDKTVDISLAIGLPPEHFAKQKTVFSRYFYDHGAKWKFEYNGRDFDINIKEVYVFPQAYAAIATKSSLLKEYSTTYIIDIGGYTVDVLLLSDGKPNLQCCHSFELGMIPMFGDITSRINSEYGQKIGDTHIVDVLSGKKSMLSAELKEFIKSKAQAHTMDILDTLREHGIDLTTNPAIFIGGGSAILKDYILKSKRVVPDFTEFIEDVSANAVGYEALAKIAVKRTADKK